MELNDVLHGQIGVLFGLGSKHKLFLNRLLWHESVLAKDDTFQIVGPFL